MSWANEWIRKIKRDSSAIKHRINKENLKKLSKEDLVTVIAELVSQHCCSDENCDTGALSADAKAFAVLSIAGLMEIEIAYHRYARGKLADIWGDIIESFKEADAEREESDRMDKIRLFAESRKKVAEKELDKLGYFDENWDRINDLVGGDIMLAYRLGIYESMYNLMNALLKVLDEEEKRGDEE